MFRLIASCVAVLVLAGGVVHGQAGVGNDKAPFTGTHFNRYWQQPWFSEPGVRQQLKLTDEQLSRLNQAYGSAYSSFNDSTTGFQNSTEAQRQERLRQSYGTFHKGLDAASRDVLTPAQQPRFNQLWMQYRGYDAVMDPATARQLNLTDEQIQTLRKYDAAYQQRMTELLSQYRKDKNVAIQGFEQLQPQVSQQIYQVLNPDQRLRWDAMSGDRYRFQPFYGYTPR